MSSFTGRQVRGKASAVLDLCDREGRVRITRKDGQSYILERIKRLAKRSQKAPAQSVAVAGARSEFKSGKVRPSTPSEIMRRIGS